MWGTWNATTAKSKPTSYDNMSPASMSGMRRGIIAASDIAAISSMNLPAYAPPLRESESCAETCEYADIVSCGFVRLNLSSGACRSHSSETRVLGVLRGGGGETSVGR